MNAPRSSSMRSHSSRMKCFTNLSESARWRKRSSVRPGVPTTMCGAVVGFFSWSICAKHTSCNQWTILCAGKPTFRHIVQPYTILVCHDDQGIRRAYLRLKRYTAEKDADAYVGHVLGEALVLLGDLEGQLSRMTKHEYRNLWMSG